MPRQLVRVFTSLCPVLAAASATAANLIVYDDQSRNGFDQGCSFPSPSANFDFANGAPVHGGIHSVRFTPDHDNAVSWCTPATYSATNDYSGIDFWVNGGASGNQNVRAVLGLGGNTVASASLASLIGGNVPANAWAHVQWNFGAAYNGQFDQISLQDLSGAVQASLYIDDVSLIAAAAAAPTQNSVFTDSFEPEYLLVPQYGNSDGKGGYTESNRIKVFQRTANTADFAFVCTATLAAGIRPNALAFAPDGYLWVVDDSSSMLRRYTLQSIVTLQSAFNCGSPVSDKNVGAVGNGTSIFDLAFFGTNAYVSQSDFIGTNQILRFTLANLNAGTNSSTPLTNAGLAIPTGLAFDAQGRLWIANYNNGLGTLVRMNNPSTGAAIDVTISNAGGGGHAMNGAEGLAFDQFGTLWVGNNIEPTMYGFAASQLAATGNPAPIGQINMPTPGGHNGFSGYVGGIAIDRHGDLRANYEYDFTVRAFSVNALPWGGPYTSYTSSELTVLNGATTDPGRGGIAIWPRPPTLHIQ